MELWVHVFGDEGWIFESLDAGTAGRKLEHTLIAEEAGRIVSAVDVFVREMRDEHGEPVLVGGIGSVATHEDHRKKGHSGRLLLDSVELMRREGCAWSLLFTGNFAHYGRYGWETTPWRKRVCSRPLGWESRDLFEIRNLGNSGPWPLEEMAQIYESFNARRPLSHVRTRRYWDTPIRVRLERPERRTWVATRKGAVAAYLVASFHDGRPPEVCEVGYLPGAATAVTTLLGTAGDGIEGEVVVRLPSDPVVDGSLASLFGQVREEETSGPMSRPIAPDWSIERIKALTAMPTAHCWDLDGF